MRLTDKQCQAIRQASNEIFGENTVVIVFGSRIDDSLKGGDIDLLVELPSAIEKPAWLAAKLSAKLSAKVSRLMAGRHVDVLLSAPNLAQLPIHQQAKLTGVTL